MPFQTHSHPAFGEPAALPGYRSILLAVDSSDHSNRGVIEAVALAERYGSRLTAAHVYAAKLHDLRFRQMEGGLPEQFRQEQELERQRDVHDDLITRGLAIITDSYLDQVDRAAEGRLLDIARRSLEGKNYRELVREANGGAYDLLVMGALGLGAVRSSRIGTVCQRVARRAAIDTLVIKQPSRPLGEGPIVVAVDGSEKAYGGLLTALSLAGHWQVPVSVVSAFDPYYHYVAFNRIAGVLSAEAGKVFKFQEQEKLHEEIIDSGLARIYQGHLSVAQSLARDHGVEVETVLLDGKPHEVIARYLRQVNPSLLVLGSTGIHADDELDIGGNSEYLLNDADCALLLSQRCHRPEVDRLAAVTTSWSEEAEARMEQVPSFVRPMARMAILRYAQEQGHTVITEAIVEEATAQLMPGHAEEAMAEIVEAHERGELAPNIDSASPIRWSEAATALLLTVKDLSLRGNLSMRAEKKARAAGEREVGAAHIRAFLEMQTALENGAPQLISEAQPHGEPAQIHWQAAALARLMRVPEGFMRDSSKQRVEAYARARGQAEVSLALVEAGLAEARESMSSAMQSGQGSSGCPFTAAAASAEQSGSDASAAWSAEAEAMLDRVPAGFCRDMTRRAAETIAGNAGHDRIDAGFLDKVMATFEQGSQTARVSMPWDQQAKARIAKAPEMVRGMLVQEIEGWARRQNLTEVNGRAVDAVKQLWAERGVFHLNPEDSRNGN